jgi:acetyltransferase-like isoleucine patch superfamily enzyme
LDADSFFETPTSVQAHLSGHTFVGVGAFCSISGGNIGHAEIGRYSSIAPGVHIGANEHPTQWLTTSRITYQPELHGWIDYLDVCDREETFARRPDPGDTARRTRIGHDVWIGQDVFIKAGVTIGSGAVVAARSVVTKDVEPYTIVGGSPARTIRLRFPERLIARLLALEWWRFSIFDITPRVNVTDIVETVAQLEMLVAEGQLQPYVGKRFTLPDIAAALS